MSALWHETRIQDKIDNQDQILRRLMTAINAGQSLAEIPKTNSFKRNAYSVAVAAAFTLLLVAGYFIFENIKNPETTTTIAKTIIKTNPSGQKSRIFLPDGSTVWLNAESSVEYLENFADSARNIKLSGEAYFEAAKNQIPFIVQINNLSVTALGTAFNVSAYPEEDRVTVSLVEGKVAVRQGKMEEIMNPDESLEIMDGEVFRFKGKSNEFASWKDGILSFHADSLWQIISKIERWYGVEVLVEGAPDEGLVFTGSFDNEYLKNILESMTYGKDLEFKIENKNVRLIFN